MFKDGSRGQNYIECKDYFDAGTELMGELHRITPESIFTSLL